MVIFFFYLTMLCSGEAIAVNSNFTCHLNWNVSNSDELCVTMNSVHGMEKKWWKYATQACQWWWRKKMRCGSRICDEQSEHSFLLFVRRQSRLRFFFFLSHFLTLSPYCYWSSVFFIINLIRIRSKHYVHFQRIFCSDVTKTKKNNAKNSMSHFYEVRSCILALQWQIIIWDKKQSCAERAKAKKVNRKNKAFEYCLASCEVRSLETIEHYLLSDALHSLCVLYVFFFHSYSAQSIQQTKKKFCHQTFIFVFIRWNEKGSSKSKKKYTSAKFILPLSRKSQCDL